MTGGKMDLDFSGLGTSSAAKPDKSTALRVAEEAGGAEGFTSRSAKPVKPARPVNIQLNLKVPVEFRDRFQAAFAVEAARDRSIRSAGEFFERVFSDWEAGRGRS